MLSAEGRGKLYEMLLLYNAQRDRTGGVQMALVTPDGPVERRLELGIADLTIRKLANVLSAFIDVNQAWRRIVSGSTQDGNHDPDAPGRLCR